MKAAILFALGFSVLLGAQERPSPNVSRIEGVILNEV